jgi:peptidyl carrier protein
MSPPTERSASEQAFIVPLGDFIAKSHLDGRAELAADAPLLEWGVLDSLGLADLLAFVEEQFALSIPLGEITPANFRSIETIASLLGRLRAAQ